MKTIKSLFVVVFAMALMPPAKAQQFNNKLDGPFRVTKTFKVNGVCEMCKERIETSIKNLPGVWSANWNMSTKTLQVSYDKLKVDPAGIEKIVASAGHDIENKKATEEVYMKLPDCCHYTRTNDNFSLN